MIHSKRLKKTKAKLVFYCDLERPPPSQYLSEMLILKKLSQFTKGFICVPGAGWEGVYSASSGRGEQLLTVFILSDKIVWCLCLFWVSLCMLVTQAVRCPPVCLLLHSWGIIKFSLWSLPPPSADSWRRSSSAPVSSCYVLLALLFSSFPFSMVLLFVCHRLPSLNCSHD